jgi:D-alanyl-D-alanine carboxypeptidase
MKTGVIRISLVYILISVAKFLAFLESKAFNIASNIVVVFGFVYVVALNRSLTADFFTQVRNDVRLVVWYKTLPADYFDKLNQESKVALVRYQESIKPKPPKKVADLPFPVISAKSYIVVDRATDVVLSSNQASTAFPPASTAKIATALASFKIYKLDEEVTVPQFCTQVDGVKAELPQGSKFKVGDLLKALLVYSAGDAGCTLSIGKTSYADFIILMNQVAKENNLQHTKFTNPIGLDDADGENLASAEDLAKLGKVAVANDFIKEVVRLKGFELKDTEGKYFKSLFSTNRLLTDIPETVGIKTGTTTGAGEVLVYEYLKDRSDIIIVVMGSKDRFADTRMVLDWTLRSFSWK